jgi:fructokinase
MDRLIAGVEIGGSKTVVLLARGREIVEQRRIATTTPRETLDACRDALLAWAHHGPPAALGIGSFGPLDLAAGRIAVTPKPGWSGTAVVGHFDGLDMPTAFDTDVAAAALAEARWGAAVGTTVSAYLTVGTGIGLGLVVDGRPVHGLMHPEIGHVRVAHDRSFTGICPFHGDCLEGLASGPAIAARTGMPADALPADHPVWTQVAGELGEMVAMLFLTVSPERVVIGGGVGGGQPQMLDMIRDRVAARLAGYIAPLTRASLDRILCPPKLGMLSGPLGTIALAEAMLAQGPGHDGRVPSPALGID